MTVDDMKSLGDDSMRLDVTSDEKSEYNRNSMGKSHPRHYGNKLNNNYIQISAPSHVSNELIITPHHLKEYYASNAYSAPDNVDINRQPITAG